VARDVPHLVDHLFRREAGKMVSYLTKLFGVSHLNLAEDIVQDTLCQALAAWPMHGVPENPSAWLMRAAKNRAIDMLRRAEHFRELTPELRRLLEHHDKPIDEAASELEIFDDQLRMMFSCCHPALSSDAQVTLILKTLCGFSVAEIANALLASEDSVEKRLGRARKVLREQGSFVAIQGGSEIVARLEAVYQAIYLLFNEGYHGTNAAETVREELCYEALRLALLLSEHPVSARPKTFALLALFCFDAARLPGRIDAEGALVQLESQERSQWDPLLIGQGLRYLERAAQDEELSEFHVEAAIASLHARARSYEETDWQRIKDLYDLLYRMKPTAIVALNRAIAVGMAEGIERGLAELAALARDPKLDGYPFLPAAQGEFHRRAGRLNAARACFDRALTLARTPAEARFLEARIVLCSAKA
jgi:RNA polymerase sigma-70 factor (ECF subfamily)